MNSLLHVDVIVIFPIVYAIFQNKFIKCVNINMYYRHSQRQQKQRQQNKNNTNTQRKRRYTFDRKFFIFRIQDDNFTVVVSLL